MHLLMGGWGAITYGRAIISASSPEILVNTSFAYLLIDFRNIQVCLWQHCISFNRDEILPFHIWIWKAKGLSLPLAILGWKARALVSKGCNIPTFLGKPLVYDNASLTSYKQVHRERHIQFCPHLREICPVVPFVEITYLWVSTSHPEPPIKVLRNIETCAYLQMLNSETREGNREIFLLYTVFQD